MNNSRHITPQKRQYIYARDSFTCQYCGEATSIDNLHIDHVVPYSRGGDNSNINLISSCTDCNLRKGALLLPIKQIRRLQEGILSRTLEYDEHLSKHPILDTGHTQDVFERPVELLQENEKIIELLNNRSIHPNKQHHVLINTTQHGISSFEYKRYYKGKWEHVTTVTNDRTFVPLSLDEYSHLRKKYTFYTVDKTNELLYSVSVKANGGGVYIVKIHDNIGGSLVYGFWIKAKDINVHINSPDANFNSPKVEHFD